MAENNHSVLLDIKDVRNFNFLLSCLLLFSLCILVLEEPLEFAPLEDVPKENDAESFNDEDLYGLGLLVFTAESRLNDVDVEHDYVKHQIGQGRCVEEGEKSKGSMDCAEQVLDFVVWVDT